MVAEVSFWALEWKRVQSFLVPVYFQVPSFDMRKSGRVIVPVIDNIPVTDHLAMEIHQTGQ